MNHNYEMIASLVYIKSMAILLNSLC